MAASAAWKNAVCVRSSQPLAASCGNRRIGSGAPLLPPATITSAMKRMSPMSRPNSVCTSGSGRRSCWIQANDASPKTK